MKQPKTVTPTSSKEVGDLWKQYYPKLLYQAKRCCGDEEYAHDAVVDVFTSLIEGKIPLDKDKSPYTYLVRCVQNRAKKNWRKREKWILIGGDGKIEGMAADAYFKKKHGQLRERPEPGVYNGGAVDFGWHIKNSEK